MFSYIWGHRDISWTFRRAEFDDTIVNVGSFQNRHSWTLFGLLASVIAVLIAFVVKIV